MRAAASRRDPDLHRPVRTADYDIEAVFNADVFDGTTLQPGTLLGTQFPSMFLSGGLFVLRSDESDFDEWFQVTGLGTGESDFTTL